MGTSEVNYYDFFMQKGTQFNLPTQQGLFWQLNCSVVVCHRGVFFFHRQEIRRASIDFVNGLSACSRATPFGLRCAQFPVEVTFFVLPKTVTEIQTSLYWSWLMRLNGHWRLRSLQRCTSPPEGWTRTRTNTNPNDTEANAAGRSVRACVARKSTALVSIRKVVI